MTTDACAFLGNQYMVSERMQIIKVKGLWPGGRKTSHGNSTVSEHLEHDESAQHMLERVEKDLAAFEVRRPPYRCDLHASLLPGPCPAAQVRTAAAVLPSSFDSPSASPASHRSTRSQGEKGKPSPESWAKMVPPPRPKRVSREPQAATAAAAPTTLMPPHLARMRGHLVDSQQAAINKRRGLSRFRQSGGVPFLGSPRTRHRARSFQGPAGRCRRRPSRPPSREEMLVATTQLPPHTSRPRLNRHV